MNIIDIGIILVLVMIALAGWKNGVIKETVSLVGLILIFVIAYTFKEQLGNVLCKYLPFFNFSGSIEGLVSLNILIYQLIAFLIILSVLYAIYQIVLKLSGVLQKLVNLTIILALPSKLGGLVVGLLEGYLLIFAILMLIVVPFKNNPIIAESKMITPIVHKTPLLSLYTKDISQTITDVYDLADRVSGEEITINEANLELIDTMLEYDVVSKKTVEQLRVLDKLKKVKGLDSVLKKY